MKILLLDDHTLFRAGLKLLLSTLSGHTSALLEASTIDEALALTAQHPDLLLCLLDLELKHEHGLSALSQIKAAAPGVAVVIVSASEDWPTVQTCLEAGAMSYIPKSASPDTLRQALLRVLAGEVFLPPAFDHLQTSPAPTTPVLTVRQHEILHALNRGLSNKQIARELSLSEYTVKEHIANIFRILGAHNRIEALLKASRLPLRKH